MTKFLAFTLVLLLATGLTACSKKDEAATGNTTATPTATHTPQQPSASASISTSPASAQLQNVAASIQQRNYDAAVDVLVQTKVSLQNLSEADRVQFQQQVRNATTALLSAKTTDPKAAAAYKRLSESMTGR